MIFKFNEIFFFLEISEETNSGLQTQKQQQIDFRSSSTSVESNPISGQDDPISGQKNPVETDDDDLFEDPEEDMSVGKPVQV
jgi:hypothetical protein